MNPGIWWLFTIFLSCCVAALWLAWIIEFQSQSCFILTEWTKFYLLVWAAWLDFVLLGKESTVSMTKADGEVIKEIHFIYN